MKIAVIGGGSTYTPELIDGFISREKTLSISEICLQDINLDRLNVLGDFCARLIEAEGARFSLTRTESVIEAVDGADFVLIQIRVGGQQARHKDILLGLKHGLIGQETTGIGGFAKALRTLPVVMEICKAIEKYAPGSWTLNFTNPSGLVTEAILNHTPIKALGLCNIPLDVKMGISKEIQLPPESIRLDYIGLNHLSWLRRVLVDGKDIMPEIMDRILLHGTPKNIPDFDYEPRLLQSLGLIPMYYLRYFYYPEKMLRLLKGKEKTRAEEVMEIEDKLMEIYRDKSQHTKPDLLDQRGGAYYSRVAVELIEALRSDVETEHILNLTNGNTTDALPPESVIECPALVSSAGARPLPVGPLDPRISGLLQTVKAYEALTIQAAQERDYDAAFWALVTHPLGPSADRAFEILDELIEINNLDYLRS